MSRQRGVPGYAANALVFALIAAGAVACSSGSGSKPTPPPATPAQTANVAGPTAGAVTRQPTSAPRPSVQAGGSPVVSSCRISDLTLRDTGTNIGAGEEHFGTILATNTSDHTCTINGYPGIVPITSNGAVLAANLQRSIYTDAPVQVVLRAGDVASFGFGRFSQHEPPCVAVAGFQVFDPDGSGYKTTNSSFTNCSGGHAVALEVGPFVAGDKGTVYHRHA